MSEDFREFPDDFLGKRRRTLGQKIGLGCGVLLVSVMALSVIGAIVGDPREDRKRQNISAVSSTVRAHEGVSDANAVATLRGQVKTLWETIRSQSRGCDDAVGDVANAAGRSDRYALYETATRGASACAEAATRVRKIDVPAAAKGDARDAFNEGIELCSNALILRQIAFDKVARVADNDLRPSSVADVREAMASAGDTGRRCGAALAVVAVQAGVDPTILRP